MASASDPPAHPALQPADRLILPPLPPRAAVETSIGPPHYPAESTQSHAFVQPSLRARKGHANSDSFNRACAPARGTQTLIRYSDSFSDSLIRVRFGAVLFARPASKYLILLATPAGFEPATTRLEGECSIQLSYGAVG